MSEKQAPTRAKDADCIFPHQATCTDGIDRAARIGMRDRNTCQLCGTTVPTGQPLVWHFISIWRDDNAYAIAHETCIQKIRENRNLGDQLWNQNQTKIEEH